MPDPLHFIRPEWLWAIPLVFLLTVMLARRRLAPGSWRRVIAPALVPYVLSSKQVQSLGYRWWWLGLGGILAVIALAGPAWNRIEQPVFRTEQSIVIALDLSKSMDAQDVAPSRLTRARLKILDILSERGGGQTALIVYSSNAFTVTPLTTDVDTVAALVNSLSTDIMPSRGSYPAAAINKGRQLLKQAGAGYGEVLLITDGGASTAAEAAARELTEAGYTLSVLGVGTREGAPIPRASGGFVTGRSGNIAVPKLEAGALRRLAAAGRGRYVQMTTGSSDIDLLLSGKVGSSSDSGQSLATDQWREEGPWLLLLLLPLVALAFRRGLVICFVILLLPVTEPAHAFGWDDLWLNKNQQGQQKLAEGFPQDAAQLFEDPQWQGVSNYRSGNYPPSAAAFAEREDADSLYNLGNAMARSGEYASALDAYEQAAELAPEDEDIRYNHDLVAELLQQQQQSEQQSGQQSDGESGGDSQQSDAESQPGQEGEEGSEGDSGDETQDGDSGRSDQETDQEDLQAMQEELQRAAAQAAQQQEGEAEEMSQAQAEAMRRAQEQTQAMEQWLRRVENDPGGLLRRKFRYQYQRQGKDQDGNSVWPDDEVEPW